MRATGDRDRRPSPYPRPDNARRAPIRKTSKRRRYAGAASAVVVAGAVAVGFMGTGTAIAEGAADEVVFSGKCGAVGLGLGNESIPDKSSLTITSGDKVTFVNNLGTEATLHVGNSKSDVDEGDSKTIRLSNGTEAMMSPHCPLMLSDHSEKTTITVQPRQDTDDGGSNGDGRDGDSNSGGTSGDSGDDSSGGSTAGDSDAADKPGTIPDTGSKAEGKAGDPTKNDDAKEKQDDQAATVPGETGDSEGSGSDTANAEATNQVSNETSASGLLAALAALCLAGVGFAAIRTFIGNRAAVSA